MKKFKLYANLLALIMLVAGVAAFADVTISLDPSSIDNQAGAQFEVVAKVESPTTGLTSVFAVMNWNPAVLELVSCVPAEGYEDPNKYYSSFGSEVADGIAYVGLGSGDGSVCIPAGFDAPVATFTFKVKEGVEKGTEIALNLFDDASKGAAGDGMDSVIGAFDANTTKIGMVFVDATGEVVKLFNVSSATSTITEWTLGTSAESSLGSKLQYTNEKGEAYSTEGGSVTAIDNANITVKVGGEAKDYTAAKFGSFKLLNKDKGTIEWNGNVTEVIGHNNLEFVIPFTATSSDEKYTDTNTLTLTVEPANSAPVVSNFTIVKDDDYAMMETMKVKFTFTITDADDDETDETKVHPVANSVKLNGETLAGGFTKEDGVWTFTGTEALSQDLVSHTGTSVNGLYYLPWTITFQVTDSIEEVDVNKTSDPEILSTGIQDVDREVTFPTFTKYEPAAPTTNDDITVVYGEATDADGDEITYTVEWTCGSVSKIGETLKADFTAKGEKWKATIWAIAQVGTTTKDSRKYVDGPEIEIGNTAPALAAASESIFIRKGTATTGTVEFTITDADPADEFTVTANGVKGTVEKSAVADGKFTVTYTVTDTDTEFTDGSITVKVNDGTDDSDEVTVAVSYRDNPPPVIEDGTTEFTIDEVDADKQANALTLTVKASDSKEVAPYGIQSIAWTITDGEGSIIFGTETNKNNPADANGNFPEKDEMEIIVKTKGYETLNGKDRAASADYKVKVVVTDAMGVSTEKEFTVTVNDTDRPASAPNNCDVVYVGGNKTGATIQAHAQGAADPDGDEVSYVYELYVDDELVETSEATAPGTDLTFTTALKKGQVPEVVVTAVSKPDYQGGVQVESDEYKSGKLTAIENSAPFITVPEGDGEVAIDEFVEGYNEADATLTIGADADVKFAYEDIDENAEVDVVAVTVDETGLEGFATAAIVDGKLVITREPNVNTVGMDALPYFELVATDQDGASAKAKFYLTIEPINTKPVVEVSDIYVNPDDEEFEQTFAVTSFGASADEAEQTIVLCLDFVIENEAGLLDGYEVNKSEDGKSVIVKGRINQNAQAGAEATIKFKVQDNGGTPYQDTSDEISVKVSLGATPWYPPYKKDCEEGHDAHQLVITPVAGGASTTLIVKGGELKPADYYEQGCKGLMPGDYTVTAYAWTVSSGASTEVCPEDTLLTVPDYDTPGNATVSYEDGTITVKAPLASEYTLIIYRDGVEYKRITKKFTPGEDGNILPTDEFEYDFGEVGDYTVTIQGTNPKGEGPVSAETALTNVAEQTEVELVWPDGEFSPDGKVIYIDKNATSAAVQFSWPVVNAAKSYILCIENETMSFESENLQACSYEKNLSFSDKASYNWYVIAIGEDEAEVYSKVMDFSLVKKTDKPVIASVFKDENTADNVLSFMMTGIDKVDMVDVQLAHRDDDSVTWYYAIKTKDSAVNLEDAGDGTATLTINGATIDKGDVAVIRFYYTDGTSEPYTVYIVK